MATAKPKDDNTPTVTSGDPIVVGDTSGNTQLGSTDTSGVPAGDTAAPAPRPEDGNDALKPATVSTRQYTGDAWTPGQLAPGTVYRSADGQLGDTLDPGKDGASGTVVVAEGDTITPSIAADLTR